MRRLLFALVLIPSFAYADAPKIVAPPTVDAYRLVRVAIEGDIDSAVIDVVPDDGVDFEDGNDGKSIVFVGPPGDYTILATTLKGTKLGRLKTRVKINGGNPPAPPVPPAPAPFSGRLHVSFITDLSQITPEIALIREGVQVRKAFEGMNAIYRTYASDSSDLTRLNLARAIPKGSPSIVIQNDQGDILDKGTVASQDEIIAKVKAIRGVK